MEEAAWKELTDVAAVEARAQAKAATAAAGATTTVNGIKPGDKAITCSFIVIEQEGATTNKEGERIITWRVGDPTGSILLSTFGDLAAAVKEADILRLTKGYCSRHRNRAVLYVGSAGTLERIGEFCMMYSLEPDMSRLEGGEGDANQGRDSGDDNEGAQQGQRVERREGEKRTMQGADDSEWRQTQQASSSHGNTGGRKGPADSATKA